MQEWTTKEECDHPEVTIIRGGTYIQKGRCVLCRRIVYRVVGRSE